MKSKTNFQTLYNKFQHYFANIIIIWLSILLFRFNKYYVEYLLKETQTILLYLAFSYTIIGFIYYIFIPIEKVQKSKGHLIGTLFKKLFRKTYYFIKSFTTKLKTPIPPLKHEEKTAFLFILVKLFYLPLMLNFLIGNYNSLKWHYNNLQTHNFNLFTISAFNTKIFPGLIAIIFFIDVLYFTFGYMFETGFLKNKVKSVEPTIFGWLVALICYPPFNSYYTDIVGWYANDMAQFSTQTITFIARVIIILLFSIYLWATISLGTKCSNLTNRGIVSKGAYKLIRHPAYISKNLCWWITVIPVISFKTALGMGAWTLIYYLRAITEERHLIKDPEYQEYIKKVKYRFIPFVY